MTNLSCYIKPVPETALKPVGALAFQELGEPPEEPHGPRRGETLNSGNIFRRAIGLPFGKRLGSSDNRMDYRVSGLDATRLRDARSGYSLVEVLVALGILMALIYVAGIGLVRTVKLHQTADQQHAATAMIDFLSLQHQFTTDLKAIKEAFARRFPDAVVSTSRPV